MPPDMGVTATCRWGNGKRWLLSRPLSRKTPPGIAPRGTHVRIFSMKLYSSPGSPNALRARAVVFELGLDPEIITVDISKGENRTPEYLKLNPNGKVPGGANKSSLVLTTTHTPGALAHVLTIFARAGVNLTKLQSRPIIGDAWKYRFYIDLETAGAKLHELLAEVRQTGATATVLGEYASGKTY